MNAKHKKFTLAATVAVMTLGLGGMALAVDNPPDYTYSTEVIEVGDAGSECAQLGTQLGVQFAYAYTWNGADGIWGAPDGTETAYFHDINGNLEHSNTITISNSDGLTFDWSASNSIGAVMVQAGVVFNVYHYYSPQAFSDIGLYAYQDGEVNHVTFCWDKDDQVAAKQWCSPGYWRQEHHLDSWLATGYVPEDSFHEKLGYYPTLSKSGKKAKAPADPTLWMVLQSPQYYSGDDFNAVGDLLSAAHPEVSFTGERVENSCPLN